jgi:type III secretion protein Q
MLRAGLSKKPLPTPSAISNARVEVSVVAGRVALSLYEYESLAPGDIIQVSRLGWHAGHLVGEGHLCNEGFLAYGTLFSRGLEVQQIQSCLNTEELPLSDETSRSTLPIELEVELTRLCLPLSEIATLRPGAVLPLRQREEAPVTLKIGGFAIARAELVDIDGEVGARILQLIDRGNGK